MLVVGTLGVLCDALPSCSSSRTNKRWSSTFDHPSAPRLFDDCAWLALTGSDKALRFEDEYPERLLGVGIPVRTRVRIGRQEGRQAGVAISNQENCDSQTVALPQTIAMLLSVSVQTPIGAKFQSRSGECKSTCTKATRRTIETIMTLLKLAHIDF